MPNTGRPDDDELLDLGHRVLAGGGRIAGTVRQEHAVRLALEDVLGLRRRRDDRHLAAGAGEAAQDVALQAVVDGDDVERRILLAAVAFAPHPARLVPRIALAARHVGHEVHAVEARPGGGLRLQLGEVELARWLVRDDAVGRALLADARRERARVDAGDADDAALLQPAVEMLGRAVARRTGDRRAQHCAAHARAGGEVRGLGVLDVGADVADVREGEGDDLPGVGGIGEDLLVAGHRRVEANLADGRAGGAEADPGNDCSVGQNKSRGRRGVGPGRRRIDWRRRQWRLRRSRVARRYGAVGARRAAARQWGGMRPDPKRCVPAGQLQRRLHGRLALR